ncbi:MAG: thiamine pyrophosphate-binding protein [Caldilineaceae bacterium]
MPKLTGGEAIVQSLIAHGVDTIFGLPGVQNDYLYNALYDARDQIKVYHTRHEQAVAYMALGYASSTDKVGVYAVVPGVGLLNTTAALATAYSMNARVFALSGQIPSHSIGRGFGLLHEIPDQLGILRSLTKWAERVNAPAEAPGLVNEAFRQLNSGRPRPVGLECPSDVFAAKAEVDLTLYAPPLYHPPVDEDAIQRAAKLLGKAKNPIIFVGSGAIGAEAAVKELAEMLQAPVVAGRSGTGILSSRHPLSLRMALAHELWARADVVIALGTRLATPMNNWGYDNDLKVIRIDIDPVEQNRTTKPEVGIVARVQDAIRPLVDAVAKENIARTSRTEEMEAIKAEFAERAAYLEPQMSYIKTIRQVLPDDGIMVDEMTQVGYSARFAFDSYSPRTYITCGYQGTLGYGFATALGVKAAHPNEAVVSINGDGGFMFAAQELSTAVKHNLNLVTLVFNDGAYGNVQRMQKKLYDNRVIATDLHNPDFVKLAESFGMKGVRTHTLPELQKALEDGFAHNGPTLIEIPVGEMPDASAIYFTPRNRGVKK